MSAKAPEQDKPTVLSTDRKYSLLSSFRRRRVITLLVEHDTLDKDELTDRIAAEEFGEPPSDKERKRVYVSLHQVHLDELADHEIIEETEDGYQLGPQAGEILPLLDNAPKYRRATALLRSAMGRY